MESKFIDKINQNYFQMLNVLKSFLKENFGEFKLNTKNYNSFEKDILDKKDKEIPKFINDYSSKNFRLLNKLENVTNKINEMINENITNKNKIIENMNESLYLIKHPQKCLFLLEVEKNNNNVLNYLKLIEAQINNHKYDLMETIYFTLCNTKINYE